jgi:cell division protein FtsB
MSKEEDLEKYAKQLQEMILEQARKEYSEVVIEHWIS